MYWSQVFLIVRKFQTSQTSQCIRSWIRPCFTTITNTKWQSYIHRYYLAPRSHYANTPSIPREQISSTDRNIFCWPKLPIKGRILDLYYFSNLIGSINWMATLKWHSRLYECYNPHLYEKYSCWSCLQVFNRKCICETSTFSVMRWSQVICSLKLIRARVSPRLIVIRMTVRRTHSKFCKRNDF